MKLRSGITVKEDLYSILLLHQINDCCNCSGGCLLSKWTSFWFTLLYFMIYLLSVVYSVTKLTKALPSLHWECCEESQSGWSVSHGQGMFHCGKPLATWYLHRGKKRDTQNWWPYKTTVFNLHFLFSQNKPGIHRLQSVLFRASSHPHIVFISSEHALRSRMPPYLLQLWTSLCHYVFVLSKHRPRSYKPSGQLCAASNAGLNSLGASIFQVHALMQLTFSACSNLWAEPVCTSQEGICALLKPVTAMSSAKFHSSHLEK